jgi:adenine phosphoribosyltransferase
VVGQDYALEYGTARLEVEQRALQPGARVLVVDDVLATGGTVAAAARLVERIGGSVAGHLFAMEIQALGGRRQLTGQVVALWAV